MKEGKTRYVVEVIGRDDAGCSDKMTFLVRADNAKTAKKRVLKHVNTSVRYQFKPYKPRRIYKANLDPEVVCVSWSWV